MDAPDTAPQKIVERHIWYAAGAGLIPVPLLDMAVITGINVKMIKELAAHHGVDFKEDQGKAIIGGLAAGLATGVLAQSPATRTVLRAIPLVGQTIASLGMSAFGGAFTYAVGHVFIQHFATGGTMLDFDLAKAKTYVGEQYQKGKQMLRRKPAEPATA